MIVLKQVHRGSELQDNRILNNRVSIDQSRMINIYLWVIRTAFCVLRFEVSRSGHLKTEHKESLFLLRRHLENWPRSKHEKRTAGSA